MTQLSSSISTSSQSSNGSTRVTDTAVQRTAPSDTLSNLDQVQGVPLSRFDQAVGANDAREPAPSNPNRTNSSQGSAQEASSFQAAQPPTSRFSTQNPSASDSMVSNVWDEDRPFTREALMQFGVSASQDADNSGQWNMPHYPVYAFDDNSQADTSFPGNEGASIDLSNNFIEMNDERPPGMDVDLTSLDLYGELPPGMTEDMFENSAELVDTLSEDRFEQEYDSSDENTVGGQAFEQIHTTEHADAISVERGQEFEKLGQILRETPSKNIGSVNYQSNGQNEGALDYGGPLREFFSQAFASGLDAIAHQAQGLGGRYDVPDNCPHSTVVSNAEQYRDLGRLLAVTADHEQINLPDKIASHSLESLFTLSNNLEKLGAADAENPTQIREALTQKLADDQGFVADLMQTFSPAVFDFFMAKADNPRETLLEHEATSPPSDLINNFSAHLEQCLGISYSAEHKQFQLPEDNTRFEQLTLIAQGFNDVRQARISEHGATFPETAEALRNAITGDGDIRRALGDANYERAFKIEADAGFEITDAEKDTFAELVRSWASDKEKTSDDQLSAVCRALTGADVLPTRISNGSNRIHVTIGDIPVYSDDPNITEPIGFAEVGARTCFGSLLVAPNVVEDILAQHQEKPDIIPPRLQKLMCEDIPDLAKKFNAD